MPSIVLPLRDWSYGWHPERGADELEREEPLLALLGARLDLFTLGFGLAVIATVFVGRRMPVRAGAAA